MFGLAMAQKENFLAYSTQFVFSTIRLVPENVVMFAIDMCGKSPIIKKRIYETKWKHVYFYIFILFIVDNTSALQLVFPITFCFCLDSHLSGCVVVTIVVGVAFCCFCNLRLLSWLFNSRLCCLLLLLLCVSYFTVNIVDKLVAYLMMPILTLI